MSKTMDKTVKERISLWGRIADLTQQLKQLRKAHALELKQAEERGYARGVDENIKHGQR